MMSPDQQAARAASAIVLVHGDFGDGFDSWGPACELIGRQYRTVIIDRSGFGEPLGPDARYSIADEARSLRETAAEMGLQSFHLAGHSYGALIALEMAVSRPGVIRSLHLIEPPLLDALPEQPLVRDMDRRVRAVLELHATAGDEATTEAFFAMIGADRAVERMRGTPEWDHLCGYAARFARGEPAGDFPRSALERLDERMPVALYTGGRSHPALRLIAAELAERITGARLLDVAEAGHAVQMSGEAFVDALLNLVRDVDRDWGEPDSVTRADPARE